MSLVRVKCFPEPGESHVLPVDFVSDGPGAERVFPVNTARDTCFLWVRDPRGRGSGGEDDGCFCPHQRPPEEAEAGAASPVPLKRGGCERPSPGAQEHDPRH